MDEATHEARKQRRSAFDPEQMFTTDRYQKGAYADPALKWIGQNIVAVTQANGEG